MAAGAAAAVWVGWVLVEQLGGATPPPTRADIAPAAPPAVPLAANPSSGSLGGMAALPEPPARAGSAVVASPPAAGSVPRVQAAAQLNEESNLGLTTRLSGEQRITMDQRERSILGARVVVGDDGPQTLVLSRDEASGQIEHWQAVLRFALKPGVDMEAFIRNQPRLRRLFVNPDYADAAVEPGDLATLFKALVADPAVTGVRLLPPRPKVVAR